MKTIYWRPQKASPHALLAIGLISIVGLLGLQRWSPQAPNVETQRMAARRAATFMAAIKAERERRGHTFDRRFDPHQTGMIGQAISDSTSKPSNLSTKQLTVNPNFAAAVVTMLQQAGVERGDRIAVGWSGSFPALNVAVCAAIETMKLRPVVVASALSSQYGANTDDFMWLDMEQHLANSKQIGFRSAAMTIGGAADRAMGSGDAPVNAAKRLHERTGVRWLPSNRLRQSIQARMQLYDASQLNQASRPPAVYINVGGGIASMGGSDATDLLKPGLNWRTGSLSAMPDCVAKRFAMRGVPVIHLGKIQQLVAQYHLQSDVTRPAVAGIGPVFQRRQPGRATAMALLSLITIALHGFVSRDYGYRALRVLCTTLHIPIHTPIVRARDETAISQLMA